MKCEENNNCKYRIYDVYTGDTYCRKVSVLVGLQMICEYDTKKKIKEGKDNGQRKNEDIN